MSAVRITVEYVDLTEAYRHADKTNLPVKAKAVYTFRAKRPQIEKVFDEASRWLPIVPIGAALGGDVPYEVQTFEAFPEDWSPEVELTITKVTKSGDRLETTVPVEAIR